MSKKLLALVSAAALMGAAPAVAPAVARSADAPVAVAAKTCSGGFTHAVIGGAHKCLRRGEFWRIAMTASTAATGTAASSATRRATTT
jgi:hypothetical protein